jgi:hypothetical protein
MNRNIPRNPGRPLKRDAPDRGNKFAYDAVDQVSGEWNRLLRKLREKYGYSKSEAKDEQINYLMEEGDEAEELDDSFTDDTSIEDPE